MRIFVDIKDFEKVQKAMDELVANVGKPFEQVLEGGGQEIRKEAVRSIQQDPKSGIIYQRYNPRRRHQASAKGESPASDTGFLVSQIKVKKKNKDEVVVESTAPYSAFLEFGTSEMGERPFMHPATMRAFPKIAKAVFNKVVEKVKEFKV
tara:strand:+ start:2047 stop:2496 length:450 start_codon:yes stop_codon:yes gene_type:complete